MEESKEGFDEFLEAMDRLDKEASRERVTCWYIDTYNIDGGIVSTSREQAEAIAGQLWSGENIARHVRECVLVGEVDA